MMRLFTVLLPVALSLACAPPAADDLNTHEELGDGHDGCLSEFGPTCDGQSSHNTCMCDDGCHARGDCCGDKVRTCGGIISCDELAAFGDSECVPRVESDGDVEETDRQWHACFSGDPEFFDGAPSTSAPDSLGDQDEQALVCCGDTHSPWCDTYIRVSTTRMPMPEGLAAESGQIGYMYTRVQYGGRFSDIALNTILGDGQRRFGDDCDGVSTDATRLEQHANAAAFLESLTDPEQGWNQSLSPAERAALESYISERGAENFVVLYSDSHSDVPTPPECSRSTISRAHLLWLLSENGASDFVIYLALPQQP